MPEATPGEPDEVTRIRQETAALVEEAKQADPPEQIETVGDVFRELGAAYTQRAAARTVLQKIADAAARLDPQETEVGRIDGALTELAEAIAKTRTPDHDPQQIGLGSIAPTVKT